MKTGSVADCIKVVEDTGGIQGGSKGDFVEPSRWDLKSPLGGLCLLSNALESKCLSGMRTRLTLT